MSRTRFLIRTYLWTVLVFIIAKVAFMLLCHEGHVFTIADVWQVVTHGLTLDLSTALYILIVPFLVCFVSIWWHKDRILSLILSAYFGIIATALALAFVADTSLYPFWGFKLNAVCLQYLTTPGEATASVSTRYLLWRLAAIVILAAVIYRQYPKMLSVTPSRQPVMKTIFYLFCIPLFVIGIRGGIDESTTNIGQVYYSQDQFLNHSAVNPMFSFLSSFEHSSKDYSGYDFFDEATCDSLVAKVYTTESIGLDTLLNTQQPDIVIIIMESCGGQFMEIGGRTDIMPNLNRLTHEGVYFSECYANSWRTDRGTVSILSGWPSFPNVSVMKMPDKSRTMPSVASSLLQKGYHTSYLYGGDINFTNMRSYLVGTGWEQLTSKEDFTREQQRSAKWGVRDDITFDRLYDDICQADTATHFLIGFSTLSSHEPWDVPIHQMDDEVDNAFYYLDQCIGRLISRLKTTPQWQDLLIVLLPDHGRKDQHTDETMPLLSHIPMIWTGGAIKTPRRIQTICNQSDLAATLLGQLGLEHEQFTFSRDVLSQTYRYPTAVHNYNNCQSMVDSSGFILYDFDAHRFTVNQSQRAEEMLRYSKAILQRTSNDLKAR